MTTLPNFGTMTVRVVAASTTSIHGDLYFDLGVEPEDGSESVVVRVPSHVCARPPQVGARLELELLMGQVQAVRFCE